MDRTTPERSAELLQVFLKLANETGFDARNVREFLISSFIGMMARECVDSPDSLDQICDNIKLAVLKMASIIRGIEAKDE